MKEMMIMKSTCTSEVNGGQIHKISNLNKSTIQLNFVPIFILLAFALLLFRAKVDRHDLSKRPSLWPKNTKRGIEHLSQVMPNHAMYYLHLLSESESGPSSVISKVYPLLYSCMTDLKWNFQTEKLTSDNDTGTLNNRNKRHLVDEFHFRL